MEIGLREKEVKGLTHRQKEITKYSVRKIELSYILLISDQTWQSSNFFDLFDRGSVFLVFGVA